MRKFIHFFASNHLFSVTFTLALLFAGISSLQLIKKELLPEIELPVVIIETAYPGASPLDVEINVTNIIENKLKEIPGIAEYSSVSFENISRISTTIDATLSEREGDQVVQKIRDALLSIKKLPEGIEGAPRIIKQSSNDRPVIIAGIGSKKGDYRQLRYDAKLLEKELKKIPGVSRIEKTGYRKREVRIEVDPLKAKLYELDYNELISAIQARNIRRTAGSIQNTESERDIVTLSQFKDPAEVGDVVVRSSLSGPLIRVKDLATVVDEYAPLTEITRIDGKEVIGLRIYKQKNSDIVQVTEQIKATLKREVQHLSKDDYLLYSNDYSRYVQTSYKVVGKNGLIGFLLVILILTFFINFRLSVWVALGIPISLFGAITLLSILGYSLNVISLSAMILVLGILVDDAIIISESIYKKWEAGLPPVEAATQGVLNVLAPVGASLITTIIAFIPLLFISGSSGKFIRVIPLVVIITLIVSITEGVIALPAHLVSSLPHNRNKRNSDPKGIRFGLAGKKFIIFLERLMKHNIKTTAVAVGIMFLCFYLAGRNIHIDSFPAKGSEALTINFELAPGTTLSKSAELMKNADSIINALPCREIDSFITTVGRKESSLPRSNYAFIRINLTPYSTRNREAAEIASELRGKLERLDRFEKITLEVMRSGPSPEKSLSYTIVGTDDRMREAAADNLVAKLQSTTGVSDIEKSTETGKVEYQLIFDHDAMARYALTVGEVIRKLKTAIDGKTVTSVQYGDEDVPFRVKSASLVSIDMSLLGKIYVPNRLGKLIRLDEVATLKPVQQTDSYTHYNGEREITVTANTKRDTVNINDEVRGLFHSLGYSKLHLLIKGESKTTGESTRSFIISFSTALLGIYFVLVLLFNSFTRPFIVISVIPFGVAGALFFYMIHRIPLSFMGLMGLVGLTGVIVNDALVMVDRLRQEDLRGISKEKIYSKLAIAAGDRVRPVMLTTATTAAGLFPLAYGIGGSDPTNAPMGLVLGWGIVCATGVTLFLVPILYYYAHNIRQIQVFQKIKAFLFKKGDGQ